MSDPQATADLIITLRNLWAPGTYPAAAADVIERLEARVKHLEDALTSRFNADWADKEHYDNWRKEKNGCN